MSVGCLYHLVVYVSFLRILTSAVKYLYMSDGCLL